MERDSLEWYWKHKYAIGDKVALVLSFVILLGVCFVLSFCMGQLLGSILESF